MEFKYDFSAKLIDKNRNIYVEQNINPFNMQEIQSIEDADIWMRNFLFFQLNAQPLFFNLKIVDNLTNEVVTELVKNKNYTFLITETFGKLNGKYNIAISNVGNDIFEFDLTFIDGEVKFEYSFNSKGTYTINLDNDFFIGQNKYISVVDDLKKLSFVVK